MPTSSSVEPIRSPMSWARSGRPDNPAFLSQRMLVKGFARQEDVRNLAPEVQDLLEHAGFAVRERGRASDSRC
jgi:hypothetical protein